jgi:uncharacterized protein
MTTPITALYAVLTTILVVVLIVRVVRRRRQARIGIGDGGDPILACRVRAHANAVETAPLGLLLLLLLELDGTATLWLHLPGGALLLGRVLHAWGLSGSAGTSFGRFYGMVLTLLALVAMAGLLLFRLLA